MINEWITHFLGKLIAREKGEEEDSFSCVACKQPFVDTDGCRRSDDMPFLCESCEEDFRGGY